MSTTLFHAGRAGKLASPSGYLGGRVRAAKDAVRHTRPGTQAREKAQRALYRAQADWLRHVAVSGDDFDYPPSAA